RRNLWAITVRTIPVDAISPPAPPRLSVADSLEQLFQRHDRWFRPLMRRRHGDIAAEDLVHESYLRAAPYFAAGTLRYPEALLIRIAENLASNMRRDRYPEIAQDLGASAFEKHASAPTQDYAVTFKQIVLALPTELRDVFMLNHVQGMTYEEIAVHLGIPRTTVHHRMRKALEKTSKAMRD
ncbi:MAG: RNA polymerase sigma factor, partial [bacterium]|nr:RNA polymerase sigma factor [bacterium]